MVQSICPATFAKTKIERCNCIHQTQHRVPALIFTFVAFAFLTSSCFSQETAPAVAPPQTAEPAPPQDDAVAEEKQALKMLKVTLRDKELSFQAPESWQAKKPRFNFTKHELSLPKADGDEKNGRMTFTISSGSTQKNINRWKTQFKFPAGSDPDKVIAMEKQTIDGYELSLVQIRGTFMETMGGPFAGGKKTLRENYMMKAVIISPPNADAKSAKCFIKLVGSEKTIKQHAKAYAAMVKSMKSQAAVE